MNKGYEAIAGYTDIEIIKKLKKDDRQAWEYISREILIPSCLADEWAVKGQNRDAKDLYQDVVIQIKKSIADKDPEEINNLRAYLSRIVRFTALKSFEKTKKFKKVDNESLLIENVWLANPSAEKFDQSYYHFLKCIYMLKPPVLGAVFYEYSIHESSYESIAQGYRITQQNARVMVSRAKKSTTKCLEKKLA